MMAQTMWEHHDHSQGELSFWRNGQCNALDGSEDGEIRGAAKILWDANDMPSWRKQALVAVDMYFETHDFDSIRPEDWVDVVVDPKMWEQEDPTTCGFGALIEGQELEELSLIHI